MKVSEKSLELNVGAEVLWQLRNAWGLQKAYLRGLTQHEERREGVDFFVNLDPATRIYAFQFKAPRGSFESTPYRYKLVKYQHEELHSLGAANPGCVFYVFPFYVTAAKLHLDVPNLLGGTWLLDVAPMTPTLVFGTKKTTTILCAPGKGKVNPEYTLVQFSAIGTPGVEAGEKPQTEVVSVSDRREIVVRRADDDVVPPNTVRRLIELGPGLSPTRFAEWYSGFRSLRPHSTGVEPPERRSSWLSRGLRVIIVPPPSPKVA